MYEELKEEIHKDTKEIIEDRFKHFEKEIKKTEEYYNPIENDSDKVYKKYPYPYGFSLDCPICVAMIGKYEKIIHIEDPAELEFQYYEFIEDLDYGKLHRDINLDYYNEEETKYRKTIENIRKKYKI